MAVLNYIASMHNTILPHFDIVQYYITFLNQYNILRYKWKTATYLTMAVFNITFKVTGNKNKNYKPPQT